MALLKMHREVAYKEKVAFYETRERALLDQSLMCAGQDNLDHSKLRMINLGAYLKGHGADDIYTVNATLGVVTVAGRGHHFFLADPTIPDDANLTIEMLQLTMQYVHDALQKRGMEAGHQPIRVHQLDHQVKASGAAKLAVAVATKPVAATVKALDVVLHRLMGAM